MDAVERRQQILELLCQRRKDTMQNLAAELGVSERTIRRDVEILTRSYPLRQSAAAMAAGSEWRIGITWIASGCLPSRQPCSADWRLTFEVKTWRSWSRSS